MARNDTARDDHGKCSTEEDIQDCSETSLSVYGNEKIVELYEDRSG